MLSRTFIAAVFSLLKIISSGSESGTACGNHNEFRTLVCPCGRSGKNVSVPCDIIDQVNACKRFNLCETCQDGSPICSSCPHGRSGALCEKGVSYSFLTTPKIDASPIVISRSGSNRYKRDVQCSDLKPPKSGSIQCWSSRDDRVCVGKCLPGYEFITTEADEIRLRCSKRGWRPRSSFPACESTGECDLELTGPGSFNCTAGMRGIVCDVFCTGPSRDSGRYSCYPGQSWTPMLPHCIQRKGDVPRRPCLCQNGGSCDFSSGACICPRGYTGRRCEKHEIIGETYCPDPGRIEYGDRIFTPSDSGSSDRYLLGTTVRYSCRPGFTLIGGSYLECVSPGSWSSSPPVCRRIRQTTTTTTPVPEPRRRTCRDPGLIQNGLRIASDEKPAANRRQFFEEGTSLVYWCNEGYALEGPSYMTCLPTGQWSEKLPSCYRIDQHPTTAAPEPRRRTCQDPGLVRNGLRMASDKMPASSRRQFFEEGTSLVYWCVEGYALEGHSWLTCLPSGQWSEKLPSCNEISRVTETLTTETPDDFITYCNDPGMVANGKRILVPWLDPRKGPFERNGEVFPEGARLEYNCNSGYSLQGAKQLTCLFDGRWSENVPTCVSAGRPDDGCGRKFNFDPTRIIGGAAQSAGDWPWQVAIATMVRGLPDIKCGAVLVNRMTVLTAAHCVQAQNVDDTMLYFGKHFFSLTKDDEYVQNRKPEYFRIHPSYDSVTQDFDIAVIRFDPIVKFDTRVQPICLPTKKTTKKNLVEGRKGFVTGWGLTEKYVNSEELMMAEIPVVSNSKCRGISQSGSVITENMFCAGDEDVDSCFGDSGGPVSFYDPDTERFILEGLVSFGFGFECSGPSVYTKVGNLLSWIEENI